MGRWWGLRSLVTRLGPRRELPLRGWDGPRQAIAGVDGLTDDQLAALNRALPWRCFVLDAHGRRFGDAAWADKRSEPERMPDPRVQLLADHFDLPRAHVIEFGCFEGVHTVALAQRAAAVTAIDGRADNVAKTLVRSALFGVRPTVRLLDAERLPADGTLAADVAFHVGVLYHLRDPVRHLRALAPLVRQGLLLDTHVAAPGEARRQYDVDGRSYRYRHYREAGMADAFSGLYDHAKWLTEEDVTAVVREAGYPDVRIIERREERNGPRVLLIARRAGSAA